MNDPTNWTIRCELSIGTTDEWVAYVGDTTGGGAVQPFVAIGSSPDVALGKLAHVMFDHIRRQAMTAAAR